MATIFENLQKDWQYKASTGLDQKEFDRLHEEFKLGFPQNGGSPAGLILLAKSGKAEITVVGGIPQGEFPYSSGLMRR